MSPKLQRAEGVPRLAVLDVDGVIFRDQFMIVLNRRRGLGTFLHTAMECLLFDVGRITLGHLLSSTFGRLQGMPWAELEAAYRSMVITPNSAETVRALRAAGMKVVLLTAGVPDPIVKDLARRLGADAGEGTHLEVREGRLTGKVGGEMSVPGGKRRYVERLIAREGIDWKDVVVVGDDCNNLDLMRRAGIDIGFRATHTLRREATFLVEEDDLSAILPIAMGKGAPHGNLLQGSRPPWHREILRKMLHMTCAAVPFLHRLSPVATAVVLICAMGLYIVSEFWRVNGARVPFIHHLGRQVMRRGERRRMAPAPLTLALGVLVALSCLPAQIAYASILIAALADSAAAVIGSRWGRRAWPHNPRKTLLGSTAFFLVALLCGTFCLPFGHALALALTATAIESMPLEDWDNFLTPVGAGFVLAVAG